MLLVPTLPLFLASVSMSSRKVSMPTRSPYSITTSEPISCSAMVWTATSKEVSGVTV
ncbi:hypothetical protein D3C87_1964690 [compost metagenome]